MQEMTVVESRKGGGKGGGYTQFERIYVLGTSKEQPPILPVVVGQLVAAFGKQRILSFTASMYFFGVICDERLK